MADADFRLFLNRAKSLSFIDRSELVEAGALRPDDKVSWERFRSNPLGWLCRAPDEAALKVWAIVERQYPMPELVMAVPHSIRCLMCRDGAAIPLYETCHECGRRSC